MGSNPTGVRDFLLFVQHFNIPHFKNHFTCSNIITLKALKWQDLKNRYEITRLRVAACFPPGDRRDRGGGTPILDLTGMLVVTFRGWNCGPVTFRVSGKKN